MLGLPLLQVMGLLLLVLGLLQLPLPVLVWHPLLLRLQVLVLWLLLLVVLLLLPWPACPLPSAPPSSVSLGPLGDLVKLCEAAQSGANVPAVAFSVRQLD